MERLEKYQELEFIREWLHRLCLNGITSINLGHDPGLRGMMAVTRYLEGKTDSLPYDDCIDSVPRQIYLKFFQPDTAWHYPRLYMFLVMSGNTIGVSENDKGTAIDKHSDHSTGITFDFSVYGKHDFPNCSLPDVTEFAEELADVFAKAYNGNSPDK